MRALATQRAGQSGISYVEVLIATLLILITLLPMIDAMRGANSSAGAHEESTLRQAHLVAGMETVLAEPFASLAAAAEAADQGGDGFNQPSAYSDAAGAANRRLVYLAFYDGDNADNDDDPLTGADQDLIWVRTVIEGTTLRVDSLVHR